MSFINLCWAISAACQVALVARFLVKGAVRRLPFFTGFCITSLARQAYLSRFNQASADYAWAYEQTDIVALFSLVLAVCEVIWIFDRELQSPRYPAYIVVPIVVGSLLAMFGDMLIGAESPLQPLLAANIQPRAIITALLAGGLLAVSLFLQWFPSTHSPGIRRHHALLTGYCAINALAFGAYQFAGKNAYGHVALVVTAGTALLYAIWLFSRLDFTLPPRVPSDESIDLSAGLRSIKRAVGDIGKGARPPSEDERGGKPEALYRP